MKITLDIPDDLVYIVVRILEEYSCGNDEMVDLSIIRDLDISVETFVKADIIASEISRKIRKQACLAGVPYSSHFFN